VEFIGGGSVINGATPSSFHTIHQTFHISQSSHPALCTAVCTVLRVYCTFGCSVRFTLVCSVRLQSTMVCAAIALQIPNFCVGH
jgi:hypothetical protein